MRTYSSRQGVSFSVPDDATEDQIQAAARKAVKDWERQNREAGDARKRAPNEPAGPMTPSGEATAQSKMAQFADAMSRRLSRTTAGATAGGMVAGPAGMAGGALMGAADLLPDWMTGAGEIAERAGPSIVGGLAGRAAGQRLGPVGGVVGGAVGSALGEYGAQKVGISEENPLMVALAGLPIPATAATRRTAEVLPGAAKGLRAAASPLWEAAETLATQLGLKIVPAETAKAAAKLAPEATAKLATGPMKRIIREGTALGAHGKPEAEAAHAALDAAYKAADNVRNLRKAAAGKVSDAARAEAEDKVTGALKAAGVLTDEAVAAVRKADEVGKGVPFKEFRTEQKILGKRVRSLESQRGVELGEAKTLYAGMQKDMDAVIASASTPELRNLLTKANKITQRATRSEKAGKTQTGVITRTMLGGGGFLYGGVPGAAAYFLPGVIKAGLETPRGVKIIKTMAEQGSNIDQIANALVQVGIGSARSKANKPRD